MNLRHVIITVALLSSVSGYAQTTDGQNISLSQAYELGIKNRYDLQANKLNVDLTSNAVQKSKKEWIPEITASGNIRYNTQLQSMVLDGFNGTRQIITMGAKNQTIFALDLTQNIYKPGLNSDIKIAHQDVSIEREKNREKEISVKLSIAEAYLNVVLKKIQLKHTSAIVDRNAHYYNVAEKKYKLGTGLENDLLKTQLDFENAQITSLEAKQNYDVALSQLKYQLNIAIDSKITPTDSIETFQNQYTINPDASSADRTELKQLLLQYESSQLRLQKSNQYFIPTISLIANYSTQVQSENFNYFQQTWSPFNYVALKLSLPMTGNFKNANTQKEYRLKMMQTQLQLKQKRQDINNEVLKFKTELINAQNSITSNKNSLELSQKVYQNQLNMYTLGTATYSSMLDTESSLKTTEQNYLKAVYNFLVAKVNYEKAIGVL